MKNEKTVKIVVSILSVVVLLVVVILNRKLITPPTNIPSIIYTLPLVNALLNSTSFVLLLISLWAIKNKKVELHKKINLTAFVLSALFLVSYVVAHFFLPETVFGDVNHNGSLENEELAVVQSIRPIYLFILISHIVLAAITFPLVLLSFYYGLDKKFAEHKKLVRWAYPLWLYVCLTGPVVYVFLKPYYGF
ncbi:MAG: DUF420 domain-containing protein [Bacteroidia bacterium]|nr:DUF420 domain-containing protein [Bacteroidia bacterium]